MTRFTLASLTLLSFIGLQACALPKAIEKYDSKDCAEIRKQAQEQFLGRTSSKSSIFNSDANANELLGALFQDQELIDGQAKRTSYNRRCN